MLQGVRGGGGVAGHRVGDGAGPRRGGLRGDGGARVTVAALAWGMGSRESRGGLKGTGRGSRRGLGKEGSPGISA